MSSPTSSLPSPSDSSSPQHGGNGSTSSNLYLVTFLATLFLLLFVSCAIVLRSYLLRRRYQRRLDEAMAAGMLLAPRTQGSKRKRFGAKPKIIDTWLSDGGPVWDHIMPLSAQPVFVKRKYREKPTTADSPAGAGDGHPAVILDPSPSPSVAPHTTNTRASRLSNFLRRHRSDANSDSDHDTDALPLVRSPRAPTPLVPSAAGAGVANVNANATANAATPTATTTGYKVRVEMLQVSVLISMPSPSRAAKKNAKLDRMGSYSDIIELDDDDDDDEEDRDEPLPELVFGVTRVNYRQPKPLVAKAAAAAGQKTLEDTFEPPTAEQVLIA
ncbi:hypothetical protein BDZ97DRAFT_1919057 [Flammula alnicola]|nr:hypothetical protein BDZ97DRAFT_1919057 [Flammula alnicola]